MAAGFSYVSVLVILSVLSINGVPIFLVRVFFGKPDGLIVCLFKA